MFYPLKEYAKLLKYKPSVTRNAKEYGSGTITSIANESEKEYMKDSMVKTASRWLPCKLNEAEESDRPKALKEFLDRKAASIERVKHLEKGN
jgi:hypothetical protein